MPSYLNLMQILLTCVLGLIGMASVFAQDQNDISGRLGCPRSEKHNLPTRREINQAYQDVLDQLAPLVRSLKFELARHQLSEAQNITAKISNYVEEFYSSDKTTFVPNNLNVYLKEAADLLIEAHLPQSQDILALRLRRFSVASSFSEGVKQEAKIKDLIDYARATREFHNFRETHNALMRANSFVDSSTPKYLTNALLVEEAELAYAEGSKSKALMLYGQILKTLNVSRQTLIKSNYLPVFQYRDLSTCLYRHGELSLGMGKVENAINSFDKLLLIKQVHFAVPHVNYATYGCLSKLRVSSVVSKINNMKVAADRKRMEDFLQASQACFLDEFWDNYRLQFSPRGGAPEDLDGRIEWCQKKERARQSLTRRIRTGTHTTPIQSGFISLSLFFELTPAVKMNLEIHTACSGASILPGTAQA